MAERNRQARAPQRAVSDSIRSRNAYGIRFGPAEVLENFHYYVWLLNSRAFHTSFVSSGNTDLIQCGRGPMTMAVTFRGERVAPRFRREQEILQGRPRHSFQPPPLLDGDEHGRLHTAPGHDLGSVPEAGFEELAEMRSRPVGLPDPVHAFSKIEPPAGYKAGWLWMIGSGIRLSNTWRHSARRRQA